MLSQWRFHFPLGTGGAGYDPGLGARPLKRAILKHVQDPLAEALVAGHHGAGATVKVSATGGRIRIE